MREVFALLHPLASRPPVYSPNKKFGFELGPAHLEAIEAVDAGEVNIFAVRYVQRQTLSAHKDTFFVSKCSTADPPQIHRGRRRGGGIFWSDFKHWPRLRQGGGILRAFSCSGSGVARASEPPCSRAVLSFRFLLLTFAM